MKVVLITSKLRFEENGSPIGGSVIDLHLKAKGLAELGHTVTVVTAFGEMNRIPCVLPYRVHERRIPSRGLIGLQKGIFTLLREFEKDADVFYIDGHMFLYGGGLYRRLGGVKPVVAFFNVRLNLWADVSMERKRRTLLRAVKHGLRYVVEKSIGVWLSKRLDALIFNTPMLERLYLDFGFANPKQGIIQDFVSTIDLSKRFAMTEASVDIREREQALIRMLATGRMLPEKGFDLVIRAFHALKNKGRFRLILSGGGPERDRLQALVRSLNLEAYISFPGWIPADELYRLFASSHMFIFPKWWIEYGSALLTETFAFGLPGIVPRGGALEWLSAGAVLTFAWEDVTELTECMERLGADRELRQALARQALMRARELDYRVLTQRLESVLKSCVTM